MKVLLVCRLMSGFVSSVTRGRWRPSGSPAIHKLIEALDHEDDVCFVFTVKDRGWTFESDWEVPRDKQVTLSGLTHPVLILAGTAALPSWLGRWRGYVSDLRQTWRLFREVGRFRPDVVYLDRSNVLAAALLARFTRVPVVLRVLGVTPAMKQITVGRAPSHVVLRWAYRAPFALVICSMDGSGGAAWLAEMLRPETPRCVLLNGVDPPRDPAGRSALVSPTDTRLRVLLLGRLEPLKRCQEFIDALLSLAGARDRIRAIIVGAGDEEATLRARVDDAGAEDYITFLGALPHDRVGEVLNQADIYVSLNRQGNLSNANLEAMAAGLCFVIPEADPATGADVETRDVIPEEAAIRIPQDRMVEALAGTLATLAARPEEVAARRAAMSRVAAGLSTWAARIAVERSMLAAVANGRPIPQAGASDPAAIA